MAGRRESDGVIGDAKERGMPQLEPALSSSPIVVLTSLILLAGHTSNAPLHGSNKVLQHELLNLLTRAWAVSI